VARRGRRSLAGIACVLSASVVAGGQVDASARTDAVLQEEGSCDPPRFHLNMGASDGNWVGEAEGVSFMHHVERKVVVFEVAAGYRASVVC
jgi:hypothetical protein